MYEKELSLLLALVNHLEKTLVMLLAFDHIHRKGLVSNTNTADLLRLFQ